ncbi:MAG: hypothetical protein JSR32_01305 [Proteobacteria bacterium]|nr:hypothetical protein [Pseudomonadota bacterium]
MGKTIVLAHGILGFGHIPLISVNYFNDVARYLRQFNHRVLEPQVSPIGLVKTRGIEFEAAIRQEVSENEEIHIIAHSMGGLDARYALAKFPKLANQVKTLITIGTPHRGSPVADVVVNNTGGELYDLIPWYIKEWQGGLVDLTTKAAEKFNEEIKDIDGVRYIEIAGDASKARERLIFFKLAQVIGNLNNGEINDGVVTRSSALREGHEHLPDWPVDHAGEIGWNHTALLRYPTMMLPFFQTSYQEHLARYRAIVEML